jgi:hypothetical protein
MGAIADRSDIDDSLDWLFGNRGRADYVAVVLPGQTTVNNDLISGQSVSARTRLKKPPLLDATRSPA